METVHTPIIADSRSMEALADNSVDLVVTSPPYPMIEMWDSIFSSLDPKVGQHLKKGDGPRAFEAMHKILDHVWAECFRVLKPGRFACINIGDATRTIQEQFRLYANHARILSFAQSLGFSCLPCILWRKQTNAPNKFMGSGMLPAGAYVTLEHEYILILRKGGKRVFSKPADKLNRRRSALFWEERNTWFSDIWFDIKGTTQALGDTASRKRSAAFPFELPFRLIQMYSVKEDRVLDPFLGTGTTMAAAMVSARNSVGYEMDPGLGPKISATTDTLIPFADEQIRQRLVRHITFVKERLAAKGPLKHENVHYGFPVMTSQEKELLLTLPRTITQAKDHAAYRVCYDDAPIEAFCQAWSKIFKTREPAEPKAPVKQPPPKTRKVRNPNYVSGGLFPDES